MNNKKNKYKKIQSSQSQSVIDSFLNSVFNNNQAIMLLVDFENNQKILDANESALNFYGYTRKEILMLDMGSIITNSEEERQRLIEKAIKLPHSSYQFIHKTSSGILKTVEVNASTVDYKNKKVMFIIVHDITDLKVIEVALKESEERFRGLADATTEAVFLSENGICIDQNKRAEELFGYTHNEAVGKDAIDWIANDYKDLVGNNMASEYSEKYEVISLRKNGSTFPSEIKGKMLNYKGRRVRVTALRDLTESKKALFELKKSNERFELAMAGSNMGIWDWWVQTGDLHVNKRWAEMLGYKLEEITPLAHDIWLELCNPDDIKERDKNFEKYNKKEIDFYKCDLRMKHKDGFWVWIQTQGKVFEWTEDGKPLRMSGTHLDINEKKVSEIKLLESENKFRSYFESSPLALWEEDYADLKKYLNNLPVSSEEELRNYLSENTDEIFRCLKLVKILNMNKATLDLYEADSRDMMIDNFTNIFTPESLNDFKDELISLYNNDRSYNCIFSDKTLKGRDIIIKFEMTQISENKYLNTSTDITEQKSMQKKLEESESKFRSYFESSPLSLLEEDFSAVIKYFQSLPVSDAVELREYLENHPEVISKCLSLIKILNVNKATMELYGLDSKPNNLLRFTRKSDKSGFNAFIEELILLYLNKSLITLQFQDQHSNGNKINVKLEMRHLSNYKYLVTIIDLTEIKKNELYLYELLTQAKADFETKEILLREINHRVKNNLSSFIGMLYAEKKQSGSDPNAVQMEHVDNLINRIKGISIAHDMLSRSQWAPISVFKLTEKIIHSLNHLIPKDRVINVKLNPSNIFLDADQSHSTAILFNELYSNSIEHASHPGEKIEVEIEIIDRKGTIIIIYRDTGPGYPEEILKSQFKNVGMYLIKNIIEQSLRGVFKISNQDGARIYIEFPGGSRLEEL